MKRNTLVGMAGGLAAGVGLTALIVSAAPSWANKEVSLGLGGQVTTSLAAQTANWGQVPQLADLVDQVSPSVVQILVRQPGRTLTAANIPEEFRGSPFEQFFGRQFGEGDGDPRGRVPDAMASGSGFFIDGQGYIVTNNHVVENATRVQVVLKGGRKVEAKVIGTDARTDLAVIKVDQKDASPGLKWGDSDKSRPGDSIFAIGSPFQLGNTVTAGIVSARGRDIGSGPYDDFIQVDAPINQGNSGGPLFNTRGEVIGVNSAIYSPTGGNVGIGFSIPSRMAQSVVDQIVAGGSVARGFLGVGITPVDQDTAASLGLKEAKGALVQEVNDDTPASRAGLRVGDIITRFGDRDVADNHELTRLVGETKAGATRDLRIIRDGREQTLKVTIAALKEEAKVGKPELSEPKSSGPAGATVSLKSLGLTLRTSDGAAVVTEVEVNSPAHDKQLLEGDRILMVQGVSVKSAEAVEKAVAEAKAKNRGAVQLQIERQGRGTTQRSLVAVPFALN